MDVAARFFEQVFIVVSQQDHRFFAVVDETVGEAGLVFNQQRDAILAADVFCGDDRKFVPGNIARETNFANAAARRGAAHGDAVEHAGKNEVVNVAGTPCYFFAPFLARNRFSDTARIHRKPP